MKVKMHAFCGFEGWKKPSRAHWFDAGLDCWSAAVRTLKPGETAKIPLGFSLEIPHGNVVLLTPRSSLNAKGIDVKLGTIDSGYSGEICAVVANNSKEPFEIDFSTKICQLVMLPIHEIEPILDDEFEAASSRGAGGFGSTDDERRSAMPSRKSIIADSHVAMEGGR